MLPFLFSAALSNCFESKLSNVILHDTSYVNCSTGVNLNNPNLIALVLSCRFVNCYAVTNGAGILFYGADLTILSCAFENGVAPTSGSAVYASHSPTDTHQDWSMNESYAIGGLTDKGTCYFGMRPNLVLSRLNLSHNMALSWGSAIAIVLPHFVSLDYIIVHANGDFNCFLLEDRTDNHSVRCLSVRRNVCHPANTVTRLGMFCILSSWVIRDSVFAENDLTYMVSQYTSVHNSTLAFENCHFDHLEFLLASHGAVAVTVGCAVGLPVPNAQPACITFVNQTLEATPAGTVTAVATDVPVSTVAATVVETTVAASAEKTVAATGVPVGTVAASAVVKTVGATATALPRTSHVEWLAVRESFVGPALAIAGGGLAFSSVLFAIVLWIRRRRRDNSNHDLSVGLTEDDERAQAAAGISGNGGPPEKKAVIPEEPSASSYPTPPYAAGGTAYAPPVSPYETPYVPAPDFQDPNDS
jgi:hypothetical protein